MAIVISGISVPFTTDHEQVYEIAKRRAGVSNVQSIYIVKRSVDARRRSDIRFVYTVGIKCADEHQEEQLVKRAADTAVKSYTYTEPRFTPGDAALKNRPVVVGFGPAGIFAALILAQNGYRPIVIERGAPVDERVAKVERFWKTGELDSESNVQFGEGGAGTFSDGKLTTRINDPLCEFIQRELVHHGGEPSILLSAKPHIGTDFLRGIVKSIRQEIIALGGEVRFGTALTGIRTLSGRVVGITTTAGDIAAEQLILAVGHSARDVFTLLHKGGVEVAPKAFSVGARIEHLQTEVDRGLYGEFAGNPLLPTGEYQLAHREGQNGVYTFCMCPGGFVVPSSSESGMVVVNGMSEYSRNQKNANSAVVVSVDSAEYGTGWDAGIRYQRQLERRAFELGGGGYRAPAQSVGRFLAGKPGFEQGAVVPSYSLGAQPADFDELFSPYVAGMLRRGITSFGRKLSAFTAKDAVLTGVETRTSSPVRITRGGDLQSVSLQGLYPCGEGAGYAGGIMSAAVDGVRVAGRIISQFAPMEQ